MTAVRRLGLRHAGGTTAVLVGPGAVRVGGEMLAGWAAGGTVFLVTTPRVWQLHGAAVAPLAEAAGELVRLEVPDGESAKSLAVAERLWHRMLTAGGKRDSRLAVLGGGSAGDLGGFVAACFLRGIPAVQLPTTLLAQVDASLGGKTAVDLPGAKNSVGAFHHPQLVISDTELLATLSTRQRYCGLAEVAKMAFLLDPELFERLEDELPRLAAGDPEALGPVVAAAARAKIGVVESDPREGDRRRLLNFGHTLGHALEAALGYRRLEHGEAVVYGMLFVLRLALRRGLDRREAERLRGLLERFELPPLPTSGPDGLDPGELLAAIARDKKARRGGVAWVLPAALGEGRVVEPDDGDAVTPEEVAEELPAFLADPLAAF